MQTKEKELKDRIASIPGIEKLTIKDVIEIINELVNKNALPRN